ncbi:MAG: ubiquinol-cytochrome C chaperone family protein [Novosphingobium sp.]
MSFLSRIFAPRRDDRAPVRVLWHRIVELARDRRWYARSGVADTVPGRFDAVTLVLALVVLRMEREAALMPAAALLTELFVEDMDGQLRQSGVGDLVVGKHIGKLMGVLGGRLGALREALPGGLDALTPVIARNLSLVEGAAPDEAARLALALAASLDMSSGDDLLAGRIAL